MHNQKHPFISSILYLIISLIFGAPTSSADNQDTNLSILQQANQLRDSDPSQSQKLSNNVLNIANKTNNVELKARAQFSLALLEKTKKNYTLSQKYLLKAQGNLVNIDNNTLKADILMNLGDTYRFTKEYQKALEYTEQAIGLIDQSKNTKSLINIFNIRGNIYKGSKNYEESLKNFLISLEYAQSTNELNKLSSLHYNIGSVYKKLKNHDLTLKHYLKSVEYLPKRKRLITLYSHIAKLYSEKNDKTKAIEYQIKAAQEMEDMGESIKLANLYHELAESYSYSEDHESSIKMNQKALAIIEKSGDLAEISKILENIAKDLRQLGRYQESLAHSKRALSVQRELNNTDRIASLLLNISIIYRKLSQYDKALEYASELTHIQEKKQNINGMAAAYNATGLIYNYLGRKGEAQYYYERILSLPKDQIDLKHRASALRSLAVVYLRREEYDVSLSYAEEARKLYSQSHSITGAESVNRTLGNIYQKIGDETKALEAYQRSLMQTRDIKDIWGEANALIKISEILVYSDPEKAKSVAKKGIDISAKISAKEIEIDGYQVLLKANKIQKKFKLALQNSKDIFLMAQNINKDAVNNKIAELQIARNAETREREIKNLKEEAKIQSLELNSTSSKIEILNSRNTISSLQLEKEKHISTILIVLASLAILGLSLLLMRLKHSANRQRILNEKNKQIEIKNIKLEELDSTKNRFFSIISNDLREPISSLVSLSNLLSQNLTKNTPDQNHGYIKSIRHSASQSYVLLNELLEWAIQQLRDTDPVHKVNVLKDIVDTINVMSNSSAKDKKVKIINSIDVSHTIYADRNMIATIIRNLIYNTLKTIPDQGTIEISSHSTGSFTQIHVTDNSSTISPKIIPDALRSKKQDASTSDTNEKTEFGLILCKELLEKNNGELFTGHTHNGGSDFYFKVPSCA